MENLHKQGDTRHFLRLLQLPTLHLEYDGIDSLWRMVVYIPGRAQSEINHPSAARNIARWKLLPRTVHITADADANASQLHTGPGKAVLTP